MPDDQKPDRLLVGVADISRAAGVSAQNSTVSRWSKLPVDPLRLRYLYSVPRILRSDLVRWLRRNYWPKEEREKEERIFGLAAIGEVAEVGKGHAGHLIRLPHDPLPAYLTRIPSSRPGTPLRYWAFRSAVEDWRDARVYSAAVERLLRAFRSGDYLGVVREAKAPLRAQSVPANCIPADLVSLLGLSGEQVERAASDPGLVRALSAWAARRRTARVALEEGAVRKNDPIEGVPPVRLEIDFQAEASVGNIKARKAGRR